ncbi:MAG: cupin domain-containing protein [Nitrospiraceae bacterium]|nr:cupin domain-containing protein [Nitrospiraceae bacterium]
MIKKKPPISCDWRIKPRASKAISSKNKSALYKHKGQFKWQGIKIEKYKQHGKDWADIARQTLIGNNEETAKFHLRYFEIASGGRSSFEKHRHEHVVICVRGKGKALVGKNIYEINNLDVLYISPDTPHQLKNPYKNPFGFFCIVNAKRDRPKILSAEKI